MIMSNIKKNEIERYFDKLWPICRSITGKGYKKSLNILSEIVPFNTISFSSGQDVFDWTVPEEWEIREAYIKGPSGERYADFSENNLHVVSYSDPVSKKMELEQLREHIHTLPDQPDAIPYLTNYYEDGWGFCMRHRKFEQLPEGEYEVLIDSSKKSGELIVGEKVLPGDTNKEILISSYLCHPSMANNELSGPLALSFLYKRLSRLPRRRFTYRFVLNPETIGSLCYLSRRGEHFKSSLRGGLVVHGVGTQENLTYKRTRNGSSLVDRVMDVMISEVDGSTIPFNPYLGSDELQYNSPGFNLPVGSIMRSIPRNYPEYHTSLDDKKFINFDKIKDTVNFLCYIIKMFENNVKWVGAIQKGAPMLSKRGLYRTLGSNKELKDFESAVVWFLNFADGEHDLVDIAKRSGKPIDLMFDVIEELRDTDLISLSNEEETPPIF